MSEIIGESAEAGDLIKDATIETFEEDVLAASMSVPIIVDFWADWCGPCKQLTPVLEKAVKAAAGAVRLVKVDIDKNQMLASQLRIQSVPTVYAFLQGRPVDGFQGAVPESEINAFIDRLKQAAAAMGGAAQDQAAAGPEALIETGNTALASGDVASAAQLFAEAMQADPENLEAIAGMAKCQLSLGDAAAARQILDQLPEEKRSDPAIAGVLASLALAEEGGGDIAALQKAATANPDDLQAQFDLASAQIGAGAVDDGITGLLSIIERDREWNEEAARKKLLTVFDALGPTDPVTVKARRRLSAILFS